MLKFLWKTQISLQVFESPLAGHAGYYYPVFKLSILIFEFGGGGHAPFVMTVKLCEITSSFRVSARWACWVLLSSLQSFDIDFRVWGGGGGGKARTVRYDCKTV